MADLETVRRDVLKADARNWLAELLGDNVRLSNSFPLYLLSGGEVRKIRVTDRGRLDPLQLSLRAYRILHPEIAGLRATGARVWGKEAKVTLQVETTDELAEERSLLHTGFADAAQQAVIDNPGYQFRLPIGTMGAAATQEEREAVEEALNSELEGTPLEFAVGALVVVFRQGPRHIVV